MSKSDDAWKAVEKLLQEVESVNGRKLQRAEKKLIAALMDALANFNKPLPAGQSLSDIVTEVFDTFQRNELKPIVEAIAKEIVNTVEAITKYFQIQVSGSNVMQIGKKIESTVLKNFGINRTENGFKLLVGGYLDNMINNTALNNQVQKIVMDSAFGETSFSDMMKRLTAVVEGTGDQEGALRRHFKTMAFDTLNIAARAQEDYIANDLDMQAFIYTGTVIEATRCFCKNRAGKVILVSEALFEWPQLRGESCGPLWDKNLEYIPLEHMGGHRCRHHKRYISNQEAMRRDKSIKIEDGQLYRIAA